MLVHTLNQSRTIKVCLGMPCADPETILFSNEMRSKQRLSSSLKQPGLRRWLKEDELPRPQLPWLPNPNHIAHSASQNNIVAANRAVENVLDKSSAKVTFILHL